MAESFYRFILLATQAMKNRNQLFQNSNSIY